MEASLSKTATDREPDRRLGDEVERLRANFETRRKLLTELGELSQQERHLLEAFDNSPSADLSRAALAAEKHRAWRKELFRKTAMVPASVGMFVAVGISLANFKPAAPAGVGAWWGSAISALAAGAVLIVMTIFSLGRQGEARQIDES